MKLKKPKDVRFGSTFDTSEAVRQALATLKVPKPITLATVPSSDASKKPYPIQLGSNNVVFCTCKGYQHRQHCRHMERFRAEFTTQVLK